MKFLTIPGDAMWRKYKPEAAGGKSWFTQPLLTINDVLNCIVLLSCIKIRKQNYEFLGENKTVPTEYRSPVRNAALVLLLT